jgi:hypothetical protein
LPPGRNNLQPSLSLDYNSPNTQDGIVRYGWSIPISYIQRLNKTGSQDLYGSNPYFTSSIDGELAQDGGAGAVHTTIGVAATTSPTIMDSLPITVHKLASVTSDSFSYTVPAGGSNKVFIVNIRQCGPVAPTATLNGASLTIQSVPGTYDRMYPFVGYVVAPTSGTFSINFGSGATCMDYVPLTVSGADQISPIDTTGDTNAITNSLTISTTTSVGNDLLLSYALFAFHSGGAAHPARLINRK